MTIVQDVPLAKRNFISPEFLTRSAVISTAHPSRLSTLGLIDFNITGMATGHSAFKRLMVVLLFSFVLRSSLAANSEAFLLSEWPGYVRGPAFDLAIHNKRAYVAAGPGGVIIFDLTVPGHLTRIGSIPAASWAKTVDFQGDFLVVAHYPGPLQVYDVSDPATPLLVGEHFPSAMPTDVAVHGSLALVIDSGLHVVDLANPTKPAARSFVPVANALAVAAEGNFAYVAVHGVGFVVFDISNPEAPVQMAEYRNEFQGLQITAVDGVVFIANLFGGLDVVDVSDPRLPTKISSYMPSFDGAVFDVALVGRTAYIAYAAGGLEVGDFSDFQAPRRLGSAPTSDVAARVVLNGAFAYVADWEGGLHAFDVSDPSQPISVSEFMTAGAAVAAQVQNDFAFLADGDAGLRIFDLSASTITPIARVPTTSFTADLKIRGNIAFVADGQAGFKILNCSNRGDPRLLATFDRVPSKSIARRIEVYAVALRENFAVLANGYGSVYIVNVENPSQPTLVTNFTTTNQTTEVSVVGEVAFLVHTRGLQVLDLTNPRLPLPRTNFTTSAHPYKILAADNHLYLPAGPDGLHIFEIADPKKPKRVGKYTSGTPQSIAIAGRYAFITDRYSATLQVVDIRNRTNPVHLTTKILPGIANDIALDGNRAFLSCGPAGVFLIDLSDILGPSLKIRVANGAPSVEVTGRPGWEFVIESRDDISPSDVWTSSSPTLMQSARQLLPHPTVDRSKFYRAFWKSDSP